MLELQCLALRKDSKMYKDRIEAILQQMEEVAIERDQVGSCLAGNCPSGASVKVVFKRQRQLRAPKIGW